MFIQAVTALEAGKTAGKIANPVYQDAKQEISRAMEAAWKHAVNEPYFYHGNIDKQPQDVQTLSWDLMYPQPHTISSFRKKIAKSRAKGEAVDAMIRVLDEIEPLAQLILDLKDKVVKREIKPESEREPKYQPPRASTKAGEQVIGILKDITSKHYDALVKQYLDRFKKTLTAYLDAASKDAAEGTALTIRNFCYIERMRIYDQGAMRVLYEAIDKEPVKKYGTNEINTPVVSADAEDKLRAMAVKDADEIRDAFVSKNAKKIVSIIDAKNNFKDIVIINDAISMGGLQSTLRLTFNDGSEFDAKLQAVFSTSVHGKHFVRHPLTFHNVKLPGGVKMGQPSEERMNLIFAQAK
jgi:hypothetical protein